jgi:glycosyltransferase involved in cell wall biosynthesis
LSISLLRQQAALIVCTKDRPEILRTQLSFLSRKPLGAPRHLIVVDSSSGSATQSVVRSAADSCSDISIHYIRSADGLPHQRNIGIDFLMENPALRDIRWVHFMDDDILPIGDYFANAWMLLMDNPEASCIGGYDVNLPAYKPNTIAVALGIMPSNSGYLTRFGFTVVPHPSSKLSRCDWAPGGMQNFNRTSTVLSLSQTCFRSTI